MSRIIVLTFDSNPSDYNPTIQFMKSSVKSLDLDKDTRVEMVVLQTDKSWSDKRRKFDPSVYNEMCSVAMRYISNKANVIRSDNEFISDIRFDFNKLGGFIIISDGEKCVLDRLVNETTSGYSEVKW